MFKRNDLVKFTARYLAYIAGLGYATEETVARVVSRYSEHAFLVALPDGRRGTFHEGDLIKVGEAVEE